MSGPPVGYHKVSNLVDPLSESEDEIFIKNDKRHSRHLNDMNAYQRKEK